jgi:hypothetical protein
MERHTQKFRLIVIPKELALTTEPIEFGIIKVIIYKEKCLATYIEVAQSY